MTDLSRARVPLFAHQVIGVEKLLACPYFFITDEPGAGKSYQVVTAAMVLFEQDIIDRVLVVAPAPVRSVWFDEDLGELRKYLWDDIPTSITEYHAKIRNWTWGLRPRQRKEPERWFRWTITNYDFIRSKARLDHLKKVVCGPRTLLVLDESSAVKNYRAIQTKACLALRQACGRVILLNGTPISNSPLDLYSQGNILDPSILQCPSYFHFRSRYGILGGFKAKQIIAWQNLDDLQRRFAPYVLRRLKSDCLDLPPKLAPVALTVPLTDETWVLYKEMRDELVAWIDSQTVSVAALAITKALRLAQLCSGFLGGNVHKELNLDEGPSYDETIPEFLKKTMSSSLKYNSEEANQVLPPREIGREKLDLFLSWYQERLEETPGLKMLVWCRFRPELSRLVGELEKLNLAHVGTIWGSQKKDERNVALRLLDPRTAPKNEPVIVVGTPATGKMGLNLAAASTVFYLSNDYNLATRLQSEDRVHRPGQINAVSYFDLIATGPKGQKTVDHSIIKALRNKEDVARFTTSAWHSVLLEE